jgi:hypothetical protein
MLLSIIPSSSPSFPAPPRHSPVVARVRVEEERWHAAEVVRGGSGLASMAERGGEDGEHTYANVEEHGMQGQCGGAPGNDRTT